MHAVELFGSDSVVVQVRMAERRTALLLEGGVVV
jgi:hypothetical protein